MAQMFKTIRLIDLIDTSKQPIEDLYKIMSKNLSNIYDKAYPVSNDELWENFIERLCDKYFNRYLSFDTYYTWSLKLKFLLEDNKEKYLRIYENSMREINPLLTFEETENVNEDRKSTGDSASSSQNSFENNSDTKNEYGRTDTRTDNLTADFTNTTDKEVSINAFTTNPKSQSGVATSLDSLIYIDNEQLTQNTNNYHNKTENTGTQTTTAGGDDTSNTKADGNSQSKTENSFENKDNNIIERLRKGFNGNQLELLKKYEEIYFDMNKEIINDIERAKLFMSVLC